METVTKSYPNLTRYQEKIVRRLHLYANRSIAPFLPAHHNSIPVFIMGYGRSGTTMLLNAFERDIRVDALGENDQRIAENYLLVYPRLAPAIQNSKKSVMVMKPILNSFDAKKLLSDFPLAKVIWMIRDYRDVVLSALNQFHDVVPNYMKQLVCAGTGDNWLAQGIPESSLAQIRSLNSRNFTQNDWLALVWWAVNRTIILDKLYLREQFLLMHYEQLVRNVEPSMRKIYAHIGLAYKPRLGAYMHSGAISKGKEVILNHDVEQMCASLSLDIAQPNCDLRVDVC